MDALIDLLFKNIEKLSIIAILLLAVISFMRGWLVPGPTHDRVVKERDKYLDAATDGVRIALRTTEAAQAKKDL